MKNAMSKWAEKLMSKAHREVREYEKGRAHKQDISLVKQNMLYGKYLEGVSDTL